MSSSLLVNDRRPDRRTTLVHGLALLGILLWAYRSSLAEMVERWEADPRYAHGYLVPGFALFLLWTRRAQAADVPYPPSWWGLTILALSIGLHLTASYYYMAWIELLSILPALVAVALLVGGGAMLRWAWPSIAFLFFMLPLPFRIEVASAQPLQRFATQVSTFAIQATGLHALAEGNVIVLDDEVRIGVVEACSGLSMLFTFFAVSVGFVLVVPRPTVDRALIILSAVPIALFANVTRITVTAITHRAAGSHAANVVFHDLAGWLMMPLAVTLLLLEQVLLTRLFGEPTPARPETIPVRAGAALSTSSAPEGRPFQG